MHISFSKKVNSKNILVVCKDNEELKSYFKGDKIMQIVKMNSFESKAGSIVYGSFIEEFENVWIIGAKKAKNFIELGASAMRNLLGKKLEDIAICFCGFDELDGQNFIKGFILRDYFYDFYKKCPNENTFFINNIEIVGLNIASELIQNMLNEAQNVKKARNMINCAPCDLYPETMANMITEWLEPLGIKVKVLSGNAIEKMGLLNAVGRASVHKPHVVLMELNSHVKEKTVLLGKGVTYDSGGLSLKPSRSMETMKTDMSGAAVVAAAMANIAQSGSQKGLVGIVGLVENMVNENSYKPDDVVKSYSGKSVEIVNTDAEGRLVMADLISYVQEKYEVKTIIDFATLTGAIVVALGSCCAGLYSNDDKLIKQLIEAGKRTHEPLWHMPIFDEYVKAMNSQIADINHVGPAGFGAGSSTAAAFLKDFINEGTSWAHLDIAGVSYLKNEAFASGYGATGFGIRMISDWLNC